MMLVFEEEYRGGKFSASALVPKTQLHRCKLSLPPFAQFSSRLSFLCNAYHLHNGYPRYDHPHKRRVKGKFNSVGNYDVLKNVIISSSNNSDSLNPNYASLCDLTVVAHMYDHKLAVLRLGGGAMKNNWETGFCSIPFEDIVKFRGQLHAVDRWGRAFLMDYNSLHMTQVAPALPNYSPCRLLGNQKSLHLAVHSGGLYVFIHEYRIVTTPPTLYKLSSRIQQWVEVGEDDDQLFFVKDAHCNFAVARDLFRTRRHSNKYDIPRFCGWPDFVFVRLAVGFKNTLQPPLLKSRCCDLGWLPYHRRAFI